MKMSSSCAVYANMEAIVCNFSFFISRVGMVVVIKSSFLLITQLMLAVLDVLADMHYFFVPLSLKMFYLAFSL